MYTSDRLFVSKFDNFILTVRNIIYYGDTKKSVLPIDPKHDRMRFIKYFNTDYEYYDTKDDSFNFQNDLKLKYEFALIFTYRSLGITEMGDLFQIFSQLDCKKKKTATFISSACRFEKNVNRRFEPDSELMQSGGIISFGKSPREYIKNIDLLDDFSRTSKINFLKALDFGIKKENFVSFGASYKKLVECRDGFTEICNENIQIDHQMFHPVLDELHIWNTVCAIEERKYITVNYYKYQDGEKDKRNFSRLMPLKVVYDCLFGRSYLCAYDEINDALCAIRFDRILEVNISELSFETLLYNTRCENLENRLKTAWLIGLQENVSHVVVEFKKDFGIKARIENEKRHGTLTEKDDCYLFEIDVNDPNEMKGWIMSFGADCEVKEPESLIDSIVNTLEVIAK